LSHFTFILADTGITVKTFQSNYQPSRERAIAIYVHKGDLPADLKFTHDVAIDTEAMGLINRRDRLCVVQLSGGDGDAHLIQFARGQYKAPNLMNLLADTRQTKIFHFARFDVAILKHYLGVLTGPIYCTRTASKLVRTYTDRHGLKDICRELLGVDISKQAQTSDWGADTLTTEQKEYAASDVLYLHALRDKLDTMIRRESREHIAKACFDFIPIRAEMDLMGWDDNVDFFAHS